MSDKEVISIENYIVNGIYWRNNETVCCNIRMWPFEIDFSRFCFRLADLEGQDKWRIAQRTAWIRFQEWNCGMSPVNEKRHGNMKAKMNMLARLFHRHIRGLHPFVYVRWRTCDVKEYMCTQLCALNIFSHLYVRYNTQHFNMLFPGVMHAPNNVQHMQNLRSIQHIFFVFSQKLICFFHSPVFYFFFFCSLLCGIVYVFFSVDSRFYCKCEDDVFVRSPAWCRCFMQSLWLPFWHLPWQMLQSIRFKRVVSLR